MSMKCINYDTSGPGFVHSSDKQIVGAALGMVFVEGVEEQEDIVAEANEP